MRRLDVLANGEQGLANNKLYFRPNHLTVDYKHYLEYLAWGGQMMIWMEDSEGAYMDVKGTAGNLTLVGMMQTVATQKEGFIIIQTPGLSRILAIWEDDNSQVEGVLVTNARIVWSVIHQIEGLVQSAKI